MNKENQVVSNNDFFIYIDLVKQIFLYHFTFQEVTLHFLCDYTFYRIYLNNPME